MENQQTDTSSRIVSIYEDAFQKDFEKREKRKERRTQREISLIQYPLKDNEVIIVMYKKYKPSLVSRNRYVTKRFYVDKNMNIIIPFDENDEFPSFYPRLPKYLERKTGEEEIYPDAPFIVVKEKELLESKGKKFIISYKHLLNVQDALQIKKYFIQSFEKIERAIKRIGEIVGSVHDEDHYDILFTLSGRNCIDFTVIIKHDNITITNSIEDSKYIGTIFTYLKGAIFENPERFLINIVLRGTRLTYNYKDVISEYTHSHLPSDSSRTFCSFCLGHGNDIFAGIKETQAFPHNGGIYHEINDLEFEGLILAIEDFIKWESLEGGPHKKMETVTLYGQKLHSQSYSRSNSDMITNNYITTLQRKVLVNLLFKGENLDKLKSLFIINKRKNSYKFMVDKEKLVEKMIYLINSDAITRSRLEDRYIFDPATGSICLFEGSGREKVDNIVIQKKENLLPSYFNGKILPAVVEIEKDEENSLESLLITVHPAEYMKIANAINKLLNKEISKNEYRKK